MKQDEIKLILLDYEKTLAFLDKMDNLLFQIKNWAIVTCSGIVAFGISQKSTLILCANFFITFAFCFLELLYKSFHEDCIGKSYYLENLIEKSLDPDSSLPKNYQFGIGHCIKPVKIKKILTIISKRERWHVRAFYWLIILGTTASIALINFF